ncbi:hypothetical protein LOK49_LG05G01373 [Camellia lanceoleosa]|uniref:Uncharacterized protein n=1 Tax=Camellia lanceoleosa TaxID=1840588 RepID=A0ACC0HM97_9ERIC|nr:hypothetical protein LOK49_LG05G01373 [Camellia lanceoleosa]
MSTVENPSTDIETRRRRRHRRRRKRRTSVAGITETGTDDGSLCFSDTESDDQSWRSTVAGGSFSEIECVSDPHSHRESSGSDCLSREVDLESGDLELKVHLAKEQRDCRICHLNLVGGGGGGGDRESQVAIELGCSCKGDLAAAHKHCAETWFKIRGNTTCEICGATALNVVGEQPNEGNGGTASASAAPAGPLILSETRNFWHGRRVMNVLLACMVFAFVISWLFHFNVLA